MQDLLSGELAGEVHLHAIADECVEEAGLELGGNRAGERVHDEVDACEEGVQGIVEGVYLGAELR